MTVAVTDVKGKEKAPLQRGDRRNNKSVRLTVPWAKVIDDPRECAAEERGGGSGSKIIIRTSGMSQNPAVAVATATDTRPLTAHNDDDCPESETVCQCADGACKGSGARGGTVANITTREHLLQNSLASGLFLLLLVNLADLV